MTGCSRRRRKRASRKTGATNGRTNSQKSAAVRPLTARCTSLSTCPAMSRLGGLFALPRTRDRQVNGDKRWFPLRKLCAMICRSQIEPREFLVRAWAVACNRFVCADNSLIRTEATLFLQASPRCWPLGRDLVNNGVAHLFRRTLSHADQRRSLRACRRRQRSAHLDRFAHRRRRAAHARARRRGSGPRYLARALCAGLGLRPPHPRRGRRNPGDRGRVFRRDRGFSGRLLCAQSAGLSPCAGERARRGHPGQAAPDAPQEIGRSASTRAIRGSGAISAPA